MHIRWLTLPLIAVSLFTLCAQTQARSFGRGAVVVYPDSYGYLGINLGRSSSEIEFVDSSADSAADKENNDQALTLYGGYKINDYWGVEFGFADLGDFDADTSLNAQSVSASADIKSFYSVLKGYIPFGKSSFFYLFGGLHRWDLDVSTSGSGLSDRSENGVDPTFGLGVGTKFGEVDLKAEFKFYQIDDDDDSAIKGNFDVETLSLGVHWRF